MLAPTDERLIHALQIEPRASWTELAPVVGVDAATLGRRWSRLRDDGIAWVTGFRPRRQLALIEIECEPAQIEATARRLARDPAVWVLDCCSGARDLLAIVSFDDLATLSDYALRGLGEMKGLRSVRTHPVNEVLVDAANWRLRALTSEEAARVRPPRGPRARAARLVADDLREAIEAEVWRDGRVPVTDIAEKHGFSPQRVADALATLRRNGDLHFRTDLAREASGWPIYTWYFVEASARTIETVRASLATVPEVRLAFTSPSRYNLILAVWLRKLADVNRFEMALGSALPDSRIADRSVVLSIRKHMAQIIGPDTRSLGHAGEGREPRTA